MEKKQEETVQTINDAELEKVVGGLSFASALAIRQSLILRSAALLKPISFISGPVAN